MAKGKRQKANKDGYVAEHIAAWCLRMKGYQILHMRYKTAGGEVDILAKKGRTLAVIEVKKRRETAAALEAVTPRNRLRVEKALLHFLSENPEYAAYDMRFDVIAVGSDGLWPFSVTHLDNAWQASA